MNASNRHLYELAAKTLDAGATTDEAVLVLIKAGMTGAHARILVEQLGGGRVEAGKVLAAIGVLFVGFLIVVFAVGAVLYDDGTGHSVARSAGKLGGFGVTVLLAGGGMLSRSL